MAALGLLLVLLAAPTPAVEGPAPLQALDPAWQAQHRRLRAATIASGVSFGVGVTVTVVSSIVRMRADPLDPPTVTATRATRGTQVVGGIFTAVSAVALIVSGALLELHAEAGQQPARPPPPPTSEEQRRGHRDPRREPAWTLRNRRLTGGMIGTGVATGALLIGTAISAGILLRPCGEECDLSGLVIATTTIASLAGVGIVSFTGVAIARSVHRRPLRRWRVSVAPGGLHLKF